MRIRYIGTRRERAGSMVDLLSQILFFEHYRASAELESLSRPDLLISRNNPKITRASSSIIAARSSK